MYLLQEGIHVNTLPAVIDHVNASWYIVQNSRLMHIYSSVCNVFPAITLIHQRFPRVGLFNQSFSPSGPHACVSLPNYCPPYIYSQVFVHSSVRNTCIASMILFYSLLQIAVIRTRWKLGANWCDRSTEWLLIMCYLGCNFQQV